MKSSLLLKRLKEACSIRHFGTTAACLGMLVAGAASAAQHAVVSGHPTKSPHKSGAPPHNISAVVTTSPAPPNFFVVTANQLQQNLQCTRETTNASAPAIRVWKETNNGTTTDVVVQMPMPAYKAAWNCVIDALRNYINLHQFAAYPRSLRPSNNTYPQTGGCRSVDVPASEARIWRNGAMSSTELPYSATVTHILNSQVAYYPYLLSDKVNATRATCTQRAAEALTPGTPGYSLGSQADRPPIVPPEFTITIQ